MIYAILAAGAAVTFMGHSHVPAVFEQMETLASLLNLCTGKKSNWIVMAGSTLSLNPALRYPRIYRNELSNPGTTKNNSHTKSK